MRPGTSACADSPRRDLLECLDLREVAHPGARLTYLVAGTKEPFFRDNATRWANALRDAGGDVVLTERVGSHGDAFWEQEFPLMVAWAFGH